MNWIEGLHLAVVLSACHLVAFCLTWGLFALAHHKGWWKKWQVDGGKAPKAELLRKATLKMPIGQIGFFIFVLALIHPLWSFMGGEFTIDWPTWYDPLWQLPVLILAQDTMFYWSHRGLHHKWWFRRVHKQHHLFRHVRGQSAEYAHTLEDLANVSAFLVPAALLAVHPLTFAVWVTFRVFETVYAHSGYAFEGIGSRHAYHHINATGGCYGSFWGPWDPIMGTDAKWKEWRKEQPHA